MKRLIFPLVILFSFHFVYSQVGDAFPELSGELANDTKVHIPKNTNGKFTMLGLAFSKKSEEELQTWFDPIYHKFMRSSEDAGLFASFTYDVNVYFIPMFTGVKAAGQGAAKKKTLNEVNPELHDHILFYKGSLKPYKETLGLDKKDTPYFFVLDENGIIIYETTGKFTDKKLTEIEEVIDDF